MARWLYTCAVAGLLSLGTITPALGLELLTNGGFESGSLSAWTLANRPLGSPYDPSVAAAGSFVINDAGGATPLSGLSALGPASGDFYAISDMTAQGTHALLQSFTVPITTLAVKLSFEMFVYDWFGAGQRSIRPGWTTRPAARTSRTSTRGSIS